MTITVNPALRGAELAQATAEYITAHPEEWDQGDWGYQSPSCGTTMCIAGTALLAAGRASFDQDGDLRIGGDEFRSNDEFVSAGKDVLGITRDQAEDLFLEFGAHGAEGVGKMWHKIANLYPEGAIKIPAEYR